jgi:hypothetical protein
MKKFSFVLFFCLVPLALRAQRVELGINAGPSLSYRYLQTDLKMFKELFNASERPIVGYRVGFDVLLRPQAQWQVGTGLLYNLRGFSNQLTLTDENGRTSNSRIAMYIHYLEVPVFLKYRFGIGDKRSFYALAGINNSFFLTDITAVKEGPSFVRMEEGAEFRKYNAGAMIGFGLRRQFTNKLSVEAGPQATLQLQNLFEGDTPTRRYLYTISLNLRAAYGF